MATADGTTSSALSRRAVDESELQPFPDLQSASRITNFHSVMASDESGQGHPASFA